MSEHAPKPALASLPTEVVEMVIPYVVDVSLHSDIDEERQADLRALSQTCRRLHDCALRFLYAKIEVRTVKHLGELHALLKASPSLAPLVKSWRLLWNMGRNCGAWLDIFDPEEGSALDLAFCDRFHKWDAIVKTGRGKLDHRGDLDIDRKHYSKPYMWRDRKAKKWVHIGGSGPDGNGEDKLIKDTKQFTQCVAELVSMLTKVEHFGWETPVTPMPRGVFDALVSLPALTGLRLRFSSDRGSFTDSLLVPVWQLAGSLRFLRIHPQYHGSISSIEELYGSEGTELVIEDIEKHPLPLSAYMNGADNDARQAREAVNYSITQRTIVVAAQGGHLKYLDAGSTGNITDECYAKIRALLPRWLAVEQWGEEGGFVEAWENAAIRLRRTFAHASLHCDWLCSDAVVERSPVLAKASASFERDRRISANDLKELESYWRIKIEDTPLGEEFYEFLKFFCPVSEYYLPWLVEDTKLGQQVLDAWSKIVERGEADKVKCDCRKCKAWYRGCVRGWIMMGEDDEF